MTGGVLGTRIGPGTVGKTSGVEGGHGCRPLEVVTPVKESRRVSALGCLSFTSESPLTVDWDGQSRPRTTGD